MKIHPPQGCVAMLFYGSQIVAAIDKYDDATDAILQAIQDHEAAEKIETLLMPEVFEQLHKREELTVRVWHSYDHYDFSDNTYELMWVSMYKQPEPSLSNILETHYEVVAAIERIREQDEDTWPEGIKFINSAYGTGGFYELAKDITMAFEKKNADRQWDGEFFDEIEAFINEYIQNL